jgi:hypothetical protein
MFNLEIPFNEEELNMKLIKLENEELNKPVSNGDLFVQIGNRKFVLFDYYDVTDPEEEKLLLKALKNLCFKYKELLVSQRSFFFNTEFIPFMKIQIRYYYNRICINMI